MISGIPIEMYRIYDKDVASFLEISQIPGSTLRENCPNTEFFLVRNFLYSE